MVPPGSHKISRVSWYLGTALDPDTRFADRALTVYGGPFQVTSTRVHRRSDRPAGLSGAAPQPRVRNDCRLDTHTVWAPAPFARRY